MLREDQKSLIMDQIDIMNRAEHLFDGIYGIMKIAAELPEEKSDIIDTKTVAGLAWLINDAIMEPLFKARDEIWKITSEKESK